MARLILVLVGLAFASLVGTTPLHAEDPKQPNVLWLSFEDISPDWGCYGDPYAKTPLIDSLAAQGVRYTNAFAHAGVCAPARSGLITGMYPTAIGSHNMRCSGIPQSGVRCFTDYLRAAGYYCTNNSKTDYQFSPPQSAWDETSNKAHFRNRPDKDMPFFAIFNFTSTHESQIRNEGRIRQNQQKLSKDQLHDPALAVVPPYYPDTPVVRRDLANYADNITAAEAEMKRVLDQLEEDGLTEDTIIWIWGDHGRGLPRGKRWVYDSGTRVPLIVIVPEKWRSVASPKDESAVAPGTVSDRLVAFVDFAPTMLSLCGVEIPQILQGHAFLGKQEAEPRDYVYAARDRMDERYDLIRSVRDKRYRYIRNFLPSVTYGQDINYMNQMPTMKEIRRLGAAGKLSGAEAHYLRPTKAVEELYDTQLDPHEIHNLADNPAYREKLLAMRAECEAWMERIGDIGLIPESEYEALEQPAGAKFVVQNPYVQEVKPAEDGQTQVTLACDTPGATIEYRVNQKGRWQPYPGPITVPSDAELQLRACRIGFRNSPVASADAQHVRPDRGDDSEQKNQPPHWREVVDTSGMLPKLAALKKLDLVSFADAKPAYERALSDENGVARYWALHSLVTRSEGDELDDSFAPIVQDLAKSDPTPIVRITAAKALCESGQTELGHEVLKEMLDNKSETVLLATLLAIDDLGQQAEPLVPAVREAMKRTGEYTKRVSEHILEKF
jgi:uncharacterized sulfatase